jgi:hypothetical protein
MAKIDKDVKCPSCGQTQTVTVYALLNVTREPELRQRLFDGQINCFVCASCGHRGAVNTPLVYHDEVLRLAVQYFPPEMLETEGFYKRFFRLGTVFQRQHYHPGAPYLNSPHIVFDLHEMCNYVLFREELHRRSLARVFRRVEDP